MNKKTQRKTTDALEIIHQRFFAGRPKRIAALNEAIAGLLRQGRKRIVLNLSGLEYLDSSGVGQLVRIYLMVVKADGEMRAVGLTPRIEEIMKITKLSGVFPEFPDEEEALKSFR